MVQVTQVIEPKKILVLLHGSIGDVTRALPLAGLLRKRFPAATLAWSVEPPSLPLVELCRSVDDILVFDRPRGMGAFFRFLRAIRARRFDLVIDLQRHLKSGLISRCSGAPYRLGFHRRNAKEFNWIFNNLHIPEYSESTPKIMHYMKFAQYLGVDVANIQWDFALSPSDEKRVQGLLRDAPRGIAVLFIGSRWESKHWFASQIASVANEIRRRYGLEIVFLGARADQGLASEAQAMSSEKIFNWVGQTTLREAVAIIARARFCVGPDTGLMHIAAATATPVVSLWGATEPIRTGPYGFDDLVIRGKADCSPCYRKTCSIGRLCMQSIDTEAILAKIEALQARGDARPVRDEARVSVR